VIRHGRIQTTGGPGDPGDLEDRKVRPTNSSRADIGLAPTTSESPTTRGSVGPPEMRIAGILEILEITEYGPRGP